MMSVMAAVILILFPIRLPSVGIARLRKLYSLRAVTSSGETDKRVSIAIIELVGDLLDNAR